MLYLENSYLRQRKGCQTLTCELYGGHVRPVVLRAQIFEISARYVFLPTIAEGRDTANFVYTLL